VGLRLGTLYIFDSSYSVRSITCVRKPPFMFISSLNHLFYPFCLIDPENDNITLARSQSCAEGASSSIPREAY
jgi:hypothetical protein